MNKEIRTLGIIIPFYCNTQEAEDKFKLLMCKIKSQLTDDMILYIYEDGQKSDWLYEYESNNIIIKSCLKNKGVSFARNCGIDYLIDKTLYITWIDSDDDIDDDYLYVLHDYCADNSHEVIETLVQINNQKVEKFDKDRIRNAVWGVAFQSKIIGDIRFNEKKQIAEDVQFVNEVVDFTKHRKKQCNTVYHYMYGANPESLTVLYGKKLIGKER